MQKIRKSLRVVPKKNSGGQTDRECFVGSSLCESNILQNKNDFALPIMNSLF